MTLPSRKLLLANGGCLLLLAWLYGGDVSDGLRARSAEVSAFTELPPLIPPALVLGCGVLALGAALWGLLKRRGDDYKGYRLLPIVLVGALFVDLVFAERRTPLGSTDLATMALKSFQEQAQELATPEAVPGDPAVLSAMLEKLGRPPYLVRGEPVSRYTLQIYEDCTGPVGKAAPGVQPGTFIYCLAGQRRGAWITLVGLRVGQRFGPPEVLSANDELRFVVVRPLTPGEEVSSDEEFTSPPPPAFREAEPAQEAPPAASSGGTDARPGP
jgi:hypothetical protein